MRPPSKSDCSQLLVFSNEFQENKLPVTNGVFPITAVMEKQFGSVRDLGNHSVYFYYNAPSMIKK